MKFSFENYEDEQKKSCLENYLEKITEYLASAIEVFRGKKTT